MDELKTEETQTEIEKCPSCGSNLVWSSSNQCLECEHCGTQVTVDLTHKSQELDINLIFDKNDNSWSEETVMYRCTNCGAKEVISRKEIATSCPFCGTSNVVATDEIVGLKPNGVIPFALNKDSASENVIKWAKKKFFAPRAFKQSASPEEIKGNYIPSFTFDTDTTSQYAGCLAKVYYTGSGKNRKRHVRHIRINGNHALKFDDIITKATNNIEFPIFEDLLPFDTNNACDYSIDYLHGFGASQYDCSGEECWKVAKDWIDDVIKNDILARYDYSYVEKFSCNTQHADTTYKYILLPIYMGVFYYHQKTYNFFVNGSTGKVAGKTPISAIKVTIVTLLALILIAGIYFGYMYYNGDL